LDLLTRDGVRVAYEVAGSGPTVLFSHGFAATSSMWREQVAAVTGAGYRAVVWDQRGHGCSDAPDDPGAYSEETAVADMAAVLDACGAGRVALVGLSLGGYVAMDVAARWPDRVRGLVISGATAEPVGPRSYAFRGLAFVFRRAPARPLERVNRWFIGRRFPARIAQPILVAGFSFAGGERALRMLVGERFLPRLAAYPGPTLIMNGEYDLFFRPTEPAFAAAAVDARRVLVRGATHLANMDRPAAFSAAVRRFARSLRD
jgi:pimeloyl-ACP methyl ester carboxylesterase